MTIDSERLGFGVGERAAYACDPWRSRGRFLPEPSSATRSEFQRDRDRIVHSTAFRRLKHKTQVFIADDGDHFRTRLTHTIEVAQIARSLARALKLDEDLAEGIALVHDFGHTPFGHTGEDALGEMLQSHGGFDHNAQALRVVTRLEHRYAEFDGLNLTWETLEGLVKHNGPLTDADGKGIGGPLPHAVAEYNAEHDLDLAGFASLEAQAAAIADDIAYNTHDIDDGLRAGLLTHDMLKDVPFLAELLDAVYERYPDLDGERVTHEIMRRQITRMVEDVIGFAQARIEEERPHSVEAVRRSDRSFVRFSDRFQAIDREIKRFLYANLYRHPDVMRVREAAATIVRDLFARFMERPDLMETHFWAEGAKAMEEDERARRVADYLAGMTDTFAIDTHRRLFDRTPQLR
ncbi:deoxyguanosinetriphosphate triphosphohydrolase [Pararhizobium mangrovi]|uniref:Deoxyguanosinetriphosphate triphosphohydrolase-like protein n=1 Tax=Pararhizobium mangrovi TaxID=2590452 RepID=A0A506U896_9HYPH|nr:deoxyguanosinetriphosphate triphosphohydrolase [Pararhizobium mangrovi]TPW29566.1 deoxyguanosinetriphosphate triphosphohydrolase [Pararhizobium mangrovi]